MVLPLLLIVHCAFNSQELSIFIAWDYLALALCLKYWSVESENNKTNGHQIRIVSIHTWRVPSFNSR